MAATQIELSSDFTTMPKLRLTLTAPVSAGSFLRFKADTVRLMMPTRAQAVSVELPGGESQPVPIVHRYDYDEMRQQWAFYIGAKPVVTVRPEQDLPAGAVLELELVVPDEQRPYCNLAGLFWSGRWIVIEDQGHHDGQAVTEPLTLATTRGVAARLEAWMHADGRVRAQHFDAASNPSVADAPNWVARAPGLEAKGAFDQALAATELPEAPAEAGRVAVIDSRGRTATTNARPVTRAGQSIYFGEIHWHCEHSGDGDRPLADALVSARDELGLDFVGPADHIDFRGRYGKSTAERQVELMREAERPGRFVGLPGAEYSARYGHANFYAGDYDDFLRIVRAMPEAFDNEQPRGDGAFPWSALMAACRAVDPGKSILIPHHTNMDSYVRERVVNPRDGRPAWAPMSFPRPIDRQTLRAFEIHQGRGSFEAETPDPRWRGQFGGFGASFQSALMRGYRLGVTGGTDNHQGWPTRAGEGGPLGLTGVVADELTTRAVFDAIYQRRTYATTGPRIVADVTLNGQPVGSELTLEPDAPRVMEIDLHGTAAWDSVQIISAGVVIDELQVPAGAEHFQAQWQDPRPGRPCTDVYYYLRARQVDGHCLWCSPFWIDMP